MSESLTAPHAHFVQTQFVLNAMFRHFLAPSLNVIPEASSLENH